MQKAASTVLPRLTNAPVSDFERTAQLQDDGCTILLRGCNHTRDKDLCNHARLIEDDADDVLDIAPPSM